MKPIVLVAALAAFSTMLQSQTPSAASKPSEKLTSHVYRWDELKVEPTPTGVRRALFDGPTTSLDKLHGHITTLNPGEKSGDPRLHLQEEVIIVKEGTLEVTYDGNVRTAPAGSVIFFQAHAVTAL